MKPRKTVSVVCVPVVEGSANLAIDDVKLKRRIRIDRLGLVAYREDDCSPPLVRLPVVRHERNSVLVELPDGGTAWVREFED